MKPVSIIILCVLFSIVFISAQQESASDSTQISRQNFQSPSQERLYDLESEFINYKRETNMELLKMNKEIDALWINKFFGFFAASAIVGAVLGFLGIRFSLRKIIDKKVVDQVTKYMESDKSAITILENEIYSSKWKNLLRKKPILVLNNKNTIDNKNFKVAMKAFTHDSQSISDLNKAQQLNFENYEIVLLENYSEKGGWNFNDAKTVDELGDFMRKVVADGAFFFCYTNEFIPNHLKNEPGLKDNQNFATSPAQLYSNLMNTLKYLYLKEQF